MASGANHSRLTSMTYPNGRVLNYNYTSGLDSNISRLCSISDGANTLESYQYLGYGSVVSRDHAQPGVNLSYIKLSTESVGDGGDQYTELDRFGRVIDQRWRTAGGTDKDRFGSAYDRDSNRLYKENVISSANSELYSYDNLNQLTSYERGTLNGTKTGLSGSASRSQSWDFDGLGNFDSQTTDGVAQTRNHNQQNEITSVSGATTPLYDANGNMTTDETGRTFKYDAWNRLVETKNSGGTTLATYKWDGAGRRVQETRGSNTTDLYYSSQWQVLEERVGGTAKFSYAWSPVYVDAMIARDRDTDANGSLDERLYAVQDANFNMTALMDVSGNVVERFQYDPFGKFSMLDASWSGVGTSAYAWNYLHQGGRWDADAGVYSFRHRELNPTLGRWTTNDPIGFGGGDWNTVRSYGNNTIVYSDPIGLQINPTITFPKRITSPELEDDSPPFPKSPGTISDPIRNDKDTLDGSGSVIVGGEGKQKNPGNKIEPPYLKEDELKNAKGNGTNVQSHYHCFFTFPPKGKYFGTGGAEACIGVIIRCDGQKGAVFHFNPSDWNASTLYKYNWDKAQGCRAYLFGSNDERGSRAAWDETLKTLINIFGKERVSTVHDDGLYVDSDGAIKRKPKSK